MIRADLFCQIITIMQKILGKQLKVIIGQASLFEAFASTAVPSYFRPLLSGNHIADRVIGFWFSSQQGSILVFHHFGLSFYCWE